MEQKEIVKEYIQSLIEDLNDSKYPEYGELWERALGACELAHKLGIGNFQLKEGFDYNGNDIIKLVDLDT